MDYSIWKWDKTVTLEDIAGLKFTKLTLQHKCFAFNPATMHRMNLNRYEYTG